MKLTIHKDPKASETEITITCPEVDERLDQLIKHIKQYAYTFRAKIDGKMCSITAENVYISSESLSEFENKLVDSTFVRISKNCILNISYLESVHSLCNHRLEALLLNGEKLIITQHYIQNLKEKIKG
ncbi:MAG: LytTR family DNA-binding domain-containing protein [Velocimicrobium sp.]